MYYSGAKVRNKTRTNKLIFIIMEDNKIKFINVFDDCFTLFQFCKENKYIDNELSYDDFFNNGMDLQFFEGDPDIIKVDNETGFFEKCGNTVFYYFDDFQGVALEMLKAFYGAFRTGITLGGEHFINGVNPAGVNDSDDIQNWESWEKIQNGIAWRGGAGYNYYIQDWQNWKH